MSSTHQIVGGPFFEDLQVGQVVDSAPAQTLTGGLAALHAAIVGDRLRLPLDVELSRGVTGGPIAHPALVWDVAIGQSTLLTGRVIANLFYRGFRFRPNWTEERWWRRSRHGGSNISAQRSPDHTSPI